MVKKQLDDSSLGRIQALTYWIGFTFFAVVVTFVTVQFDFGENAPAKSAGVITGVMNSLSFFIAAFIWFILKERAFGDKPDNKITYLQFKKNFKQKVVFIVIWALAYTPAVFALCTAWIAKSFSAGLPSIFVSFALLFYFSPLRWERAVK